MSKSLQPADCSPPRSSDHGILQARMLEWVAIPFSRDFLSPLIKPTSPALAGWFFTTEPPGKPCSYIVSNTDYKSSGKAQNLPEKVTKANCQMQTLHFYSPHLRHDWVQYLSFLQFLQSTFPAMKGDTL